MIYAITCPHCLHQVGAKPPVEPDEKAQCSHCDKLIDAHGSKLHGPGKFIQEPVKPEKEFDLLSVE